MGKSKEIPYKFFESGKEVAGLTDTTNLNGLHLSLKITALAFYIKTGIHPVFKKKWIFWRFNQ